MRGIGLRGSDRIKTFTTGDAVVILLLALAGAGAVPFIQSSTPATVVVYRDNVRYAEYPLDEERVLVIQGYIGPMKVRIHDRGVEVSSSCCTKQICVHGGFIRQQFQQLICVPNHILIEIQSKQTKDRIDAISR